MDVEPQAKSGRVLVIDDDALVGRAIGRMIRPHHEVILETSGAAALARLAAGEVFDAIVCDLMMPEMSGMEVHAAVARDFPQLAPRMLFTTGGAYTPAGDAFVATHLEVCFPKPLDAVGLLARLAALAAGQPPKRRR